MQSATGLPPLILVTPELATREPEFSSNTVTAPKLLDYARMYLAFQDAIPIPIMVFDGNVAHLLGLVSASDDFEEFYFKDSWFPDSFLAEGNNLAEVAAVAVTNAKGVGAEKRQQYGEGPVWSVRSAELERVATGLVVPGPVLSWWQDLEDHMRSQGAPGVASVLEKSNVYGPLGDAAGWYRLGQLFSRLDLQENALATLQLAAILDPRSAVLAAELCNQLVRVAREEDARKCFKEHQRVVDTDKTLSTKEREHLRAIFRERIAKLGTP